MRMHGYHAVSFRDLADALAIKSASVHYYFRTKEDLGCALVDRYAERFFDALSASNDPPLLAILAAYRLALRAEGRHCLCGMFGAEARGLPEPVASKVAGFFRGNLDWIAGALPPEIDLADRQARAAEILATLQGAIMVAASLDDPAFFDAALDRLAREFFQKTGH